MNITLFTRPKSVLTVGLALLLAFDPNLIFQWTGLVLGDAGFHRDARQAFRQHRRAVGGILAVEHVGAGHRHHADGDACVGQLALRGEGQRDLGAGRYDNGLCRNRL